MSKQQVLEIFGYKPRDRTFTGKNEAWQYCWRGKGLTVWFKNNLVHGMTTDLRGEQCPVTIDWGQMPPDLDVDINVNRN